MKQYIGILLGIGLFGISCKTTQQKVAKPDWVSQRPTNEMYYIGIGIASKLSNPADFQQVAKKNAVSDLISEIKVTVSSNSALSQYQDNQRFSQQFESDVKISAMNTIESFSVAGSWEDQEYFWIYYKLSKEEYKSAQRRKMMAAIAQAEAYYERAELMGKDQYLQKLRSKIKALAVLQDYLNEDLQTTYNGKNVFMVSELVNSIQNQLYEIELSSKVQTLNGKVGKPIDEPFNVEVRYRSNKEPIAFIPLTSFMENGQIESTLLTETDQVGVASVTISKILSKAPVQTIRIGVNMKELMKVDSIRPPLAQILMSVDVPSTAVRLNVIPLKVYVESSEKNLNKELPNEYLNAALKRSLIADGCIFVNNKDQADYILRIEANTRADGAIWGNMKTAALDLTISLLDQTNQVEVFKDGLREVKGFQTTDENAGIDAYKTATQLMLQRIYPNLKNELMRNK